MRWSGALFFFFFFNLFKSTAREAQDGAGWSSSPGTRHVPGTGLGSRPAPAQPASGQPCIRAGWDFIFLEAWQGMGDVPASHRCLRGHPVSPCWVALLGWAPGRGSPVGLATAGASSLLRGRAKDAPRETCFGEAGGLARTQAGLVPCPAGRHGTVPAASPIGDAHGSRCTPGSSSEMTPPFWGEKPHCGRSRLIPV